MRTSDARNVIARATAELEKQLAAGKSETLERYLEAMGRFHKYSLGNLMLILSQCPTATHVAGYRAWNRLHRYVRRGERGITILAPMFLPAEGKGASGDKPERQLRFKAVSVFDISQTDGEPLVELGRVQGDPDAHLGRLHDLIREHDIELVTVPTLGGPLGVSCGGTIKVVDDLEPAQEFEVLVHELAHELLHRGPDRQSIPSSIRELEAEAVAFVVCRGVGLETGTACSDYIKLHRGGRKELIASLDRIQRTAGGILGALVEEPIESRPAGTLSRVAS